MNSGDKVFAYLICAMFACLGVGIFAASTENKVKHTNETQLKIEAMKAGYHQDKDGHWVK